VQSTGKERGYTGRRGRQQNGLAPENHIVRINTTTPRKTQVMKKGRGQRSTHASTHRTNADTVPPKETLLRARPPNGKFWEEGEG